MPQEILNSLILFTPELIIVLTILFAIVLDLIPSTKSYVKHISILGLLVFMILKVCSFGASNEYIFYSMLIVDSFSDIFKIAIVFTTISIFLVSKYSDEVDQEYKNEYYVLLLSMCLGMLLLSCSTNLIMIYLSMELIGIPSYILAGMNKKDKLSNEASLKYIIYGLFASGVMLFGFSWIYGLTGSVYLDSLNISLLSAQSPAMYIAFIFILVGMGYKVSMAPFHYWTPDVYQGSPTPITAFFSIAPKAAGLALLIRFIASVFSGDDEIATAFNWPIIMAILSALTMTIGNVLAIKQSNIKRMLAYSSISHIGFIMMSLCVYTSISDLTAILLYFFVYIFMNSGAFFLVIFVENKLRYTDFKDWDGFGLRMPFWGAMMAINMIALTGLPPTSGFIAKFYIFSDLIYSKQFFGLAIIGIINAVISLYYYFKLLKHMYLNKSINDEVAYPGRALGFMIVLFSMQTLLFYFYWNPLIDLLKSIGL